MKIIENHLHLQMRMVIITISIKNDYCLGDAMYVCVCHAVTDKAIKKAVKQGHDTFALIQQELKVATCCGRCEDHACDVIEEALKPGLFEFDLNPQGAFA